VCGEKVRLYSVVVKNSPAAICAGANDGKKAEGKKYADQKEGAGHSEAYAAREGKEGAPIQRIRKKEKEQQQNEED